MAKLLLLLLIIGGLAAFILQNLSPIALTLLGIQSPVLPLGFWILAALALGALTTLIIAALFSLARPAARRAPGARSRSTAGFSRSAWTAWPQREPAPSPKAAPPPTSPAGDDWEGRKREEWEDWENYEESARAAGPQTQIRDREDEEWADWGDYERSSDRAQCDDLPSDRSGQASASPPPRTEFETRQEPVTRQQSGSIYSYSYRPPEEPPATGKANQVYDADYRVITPPHRSEPPDDLAAAEPAATAGDEDWGLDDDEFDQGREDRPGRRDWQSP